MLHRRAQILSMRKKSSSQNGIHFSCIWYSAAKILHCMDSNISLTQIVRNFIGESISFQMPLFIMRIFLNFYIHTIKHLEELYPLHFETNFVLYLKTLKLLKSVNEDMEKV